jgi:hypothetical protein
VCRHPHDLRNDGRASPVHTENLSQLLQVDRRRFADAVDRVSKPRHAEVAKLLVEEGLAELSGEKRDVFDNSLTHTPCLVLCELYDGRKEALRKQVDTDD